MKYKYANSNTGIGDLTFGPLMGEGFELSQPWVTSAPSEGLSAFTTTSPSSLAESFSTTFAMTMPLMRLWSAVRHLLLLRVYAIPATAAILQHLRVTVIAANAVFRVVAPI